MISNNEGIAPSSSKLSISA